MNYTSIKLVDSPMASGEKPGEGEIAIKGRNIFMGYLNLPGKTDEAVRQTEQFSETCNLDFAVNNNLYILNE